eukprot:9215441-Lingulodinium_polyedra.AAC.1
MDHSRDCTIVDWYSASERRFCFVFNMWINGHQQWDFHVVGKKHRKNVARDAQNAQPRFTSDQ